MQQLTGEVGTGKQAHHVFPQRFVKEFDAVGINIHNPKYGTWVDSLEHSRWSYAYNQEWLNFFKNNPNASYSDIVNFVRGLAEKYDFVLNF